ncbi:ABC transporter ATP-binding protein [Anaerocolumna chitinilytica]|uniref:ABC transporter permease n=1 Tax=Anaerocolumna chitinilytica TaxID=1727145 RepID=A0A7I8DU85_9FIRM|nr:ABC transporter ATP-binding protein [Anaerocolumna chitinilytica]BCK00802.1 ABC transporter permease [Anaerocolumna chitinilytica]
MNKQNNILIKRILLMLKPYLKKIILLFLCITCTAGINLILPLCIKQLMDQGLLVNNMDMVVKYALILLILVILNQGIKLIETKYSSYINTMFSYSLSERAFNHILKLKQSYFKNTNFAETISNTEVDIQNISLICNRGVLLLISNLLCMAGGAIGLALISPKLTLLVLCIIPVRYYSVKYFTKRRETLFEEYIRYNSEFHKWFGDTLGGVKEIKLWGIERVILGRYIKKQRNIIQSNIQLSFIDKYNECSESILFQVLSSGLYILGAYLVFHKELSVGSLFAVLSYTGYITGPISLIFNIRYSFSSILPSAKRFFEFMDLETEPSGKLTGINLDSIKGKITFENVSFSYREEEELLEGVNFEIQPGEKIALIGENGAGKSTLINLLLRFCQPVGGRILLDGINIEGFKLRDYRKLFSVVSQDIYLFDSTIEENIGLFPFIKDKRVKEAAIKSGAKNFIDEMPDNYKSKIGNNGSLLSGGQRQKLAMARAFARSSKILILDEATSNYDAQSEMYVNDLITKIGNDITVIIISHKESILKKVDRVFKLEDCKIMQYDLNVENVSST